MKYIKSYKIISVLLLTIFALFGHCFKASASDITSSYGIKIDGEFGDWSDKPKTKITEPGDDYNVKVGSLLADKDNIYIYIDMSPIQGNGYNTLQPAGYKLTVGNKTFDLTFNGGFTSGDSSMIGQKKSLTITCWSQSDTSTLDMSKSQAIVSRIETKQSYDDIMECEIPISSLKVESTTSQQISLTNLNLGTQTLVVNGGSTGPVVLATIGLSIAVLGVTRLSYKKRVGTK